MPGSEGEPAITVNPANPLNIFVIANCNPGVMSSFSMDGGATWTTNIFANSWDDPSAAFDAFGNLFVSFITPSLDSIAVLLSTNGGRVFNPLATFTEPVGASFDQPTITTGPGGSSAPGSVWITAYDLGSQDIIVSGAPVTGLGQVAWSSSPTHVANSSYYSWGDIAVGPNGQVAVIFQEAGSNLTGPTDVRISVNPYGLAQISQFAPAWKVLTSQMGCLQKPNATPNRGCDVEPGLAWDRTGGPHSGRLYMVYTDRPASNTNNMDIYVIHSDSSGASGSWSTLLEVNWDDTTTTTQFDPRIALDQTSGNVAITWYDCRNDPVTNTATRFYAAVSSDGGNTWSANIDLEPNGQSNATTANPVPGAGYMDYYDYTGLAYYGGYFYPAWADNSNYPVGYNPDGIKGMDIFVARIQY
jgi:hypothetical protein